MIRLAELCEATPTRPPSPTRVGATRRWCRARAACRSSGNRPTRLSRGRRRTVTAGRRSPPGGCPRPTHSRHCWRREATRPRPTETRPRSLCAGRGRWLRECSCGYPATVTVSTALVRSHILDIGAGERARQHLLDKAVARPRGDLRMQVATVDGRQYLRALEPVRPVTEAPVSAPEGRSSYRPAGHEPRQAQRRSPRPTA